MTVFDQARALMESGRAQEALDLFAQHPDKLTGPRSASLESLVLSTLGRHDEALSLANRVYGQAPSDRTKGLLHKVYDTFRQSEAARIPLDDTPSPALQRPGVIVFSKDRPMQLDALLTSLAEMSDIEAAGPIRVILRSSADVFARGYALVQQRHPRVRMIAETDFDRDMRNALAELDLVAFFVDDAIVHRRFSWRRVHDCLRANPEAAGFSLRLGTNISRSIVSQRRPFLWPPVASVSAGDIPDEDIISFDWAECAQIDLNTPLEVSSSVFRRDVVTRLLRDIHIFNPNTLELTLECQKYRVGRRLLLFRESVSYCLPINAVQAIMDNATVYDADFSAEKLAEHYLGGLRIDLASFRFYRPHATHEYFFPLLSRPLAERSET